MVEFGNEVPRRSFDDILPAEMRSKRFRIDPLELPGISTAPPEISAQAAYWAEYLSRAKMSPTAVFGYCSGSVLATSLAAHFKSREVPLILFDPVIPTPDTTQSLLVDLAIGMDSGLAPSAIPRIGGIARDVALKEASRFLHAIALRCAPDLPDDVAEALTEKQRAWLGYTLTAASVTDTGASPDHVFLSTTGIHSNETGVVPRRFPVDAVGLFRSALVQTTLAELLLAGRVTDA
ncbi:hypothetical protein [Streptomyces parvulus]|uniref:hypothetical protein n=1 Tax=Streptomyces parvulus TaxID=146923 RepID=UPI0037FA4ACC